MPRKLTTEEFINRSTITHGNKYDYSKSEYINSKTEVCIICPKHGEFWQLPGVHYRGCGCEKCSKHMLELDEFLEQLKAKDMKDKYDYDISCYETMTKNIPVTCHKKTDGVEHGVFYMPPKDLLRGRGCPKCADNQKKTTEDFIKKSNEIYNNKYDYSKVKYVDAHTKVCIICPEHGEFWQEPDNHYRFIPKCCKQQSKLELEVKEILNSINIDYIEQCEFDWLLSRKKMKLDFYLPEINTVIECQGEQHFTTFRYETDTQEKLSARRKRDKLKYDLCVKNLNPTFLYYTNTKYDYCNGVKMIKIKEELINKIKEVKYERDQNN